MSDHRQAEKPFAIGDRRLHTRTPVTPQAFVKFGANNYGFVFNISENGLVFAPTGTLTLAVGAVAKMRFQLPDSKEWIETSGEVAWIAESQKEAGVRFVDLMEDTRAKIRNWISQEPVRPDLSPERDAVRKAIPASQPNTPGAVPEDKILKSIFADPGLFLVGSKSARPKPAVQPRPAVAGEPPLAANAAPVPERRSQPRRRVLSLEYLDLGDSNGGIILNLGEDGMYIQAVAGLSPDYIPNLSFKIPESGYQVETSGNIVWVGESRKDAGIQFDNLPEEARLKIREWVSVEFPSRQGFRQPQQAADPGQSAAKPAAGPRKHDRLVEMPPAAALKSPPQSSGSPAAEISDRKTDFVSKPPAAEIAPPSAQNSTDISVGLASPKKLDSAAKSPIASVPPGVVQKPADVLVNNVSSKQTGLPRKSSDASAGATPPVVQKPVDARSSASTIQKPPQAAQPNTHLARPEADKKKIFGPPSASETQIQNRPAVAKPAAPSAPPAPEATNAPDRRDDRRVTAREISAASSDLPDWPITRSLGVNAAADLPNDRAGIALGAIAQSEAGPEIAAQDASSAPAPESFAIAHSLNWKNLAAAILVVVLISFAAGWIAAGPSGRKQILDRFVSQQSNSSQPPENPGATSAQTDAPVQGSGLPQTNAASASPEQAINQAAPQPPSQTPPPNSTQPLPPASQAPANVATQPALHSNTSSPQPGSQFSHANNASSPTQLATTASSQTPRATAANTGNIASSAPEKSAAAKRAAATSSSAPPTIGANNGALPNAAVAASSNKPSLAANTTTPPNASPESHTSQPNSINSSTTSNSSSTSNTAQPPTAQPNVASASASSNTPSSVAKSAPPPAPANASSPAPTAAAEIVKATVSVNASPFPSIRVPPELKSQISKQGASLQIGQLISRVEPAYPEDAQRQRIEGVVKLHAIIARDGAIQDIDQMSGPPLLVAAAANAVRQWRYKPTALDGQPVEATESITVTFRLQSPHAN
ncbi:MAG: TonB family protein [Candidatus Acidiferrales bacterium]